MTTLLGIVALIVTVVNPFWGLLLVLPLQSTFLGIKSGFELAKLVPVIQLSLLLFRPIVERLLFNTRHVYLKTNIDRSLWFFLLFLGLSFPISITFGNTALDWTRDVGGFFNYALYFIVPAIIRTKRQLKAFLVWVLLNLVLISVSATYFWVTRRGFVDMHSEHLLVFGSPVANAILPAFALTVLVSPGIGRTVRVLAMVLALLPLGFILLMGTRSLLLGAIISILFVAIVSKMWAKYGWYPLWDTRLSKVAVILMLLLLSYLSFSQNRIFQRSTTRFSTMLSSDIMLHTSVLIRIADFTRAKDALEHNLFFGRGVGFWFDKQGLPFWYPIALRRESNQVIDNGYAYLLVKFGLVGTIIYFAFYLTVLVESYKIQHVQEEWQFVSGSLCCALLTGLFLALAGGTTFFRGRVLTYFVGTFAGLLPIIRDNSEKEEQSTSTERGLSTQRSSGTLPTKAVAELPKT